MKKVNEILHNSKYIEYMMFLEQIEEERVFCKHGIEHSLDVARIAYIKNLEEGLGLSKDIIYGIALLHDIGRILQYKDDIQHHEGSVILAKEILSYTSYTEKEKESILNAIKNHRKVTKDKLCDLIYECDKLSRNCFICKNKAECYWDDEKKNFNITY